MSPHVTPASRRSELFSLQPKSSYSPLLPRSAPSCPALPHPALLDPALGTCLAPSQIKKQISEAELQTQIIPSLPRWNSCVESPESGNSTLRPREIRELNPATQRDQGTHPAAQRDKATRPATQRDQATRPATQRDQKPHPATERDQGTRPATQKDFPRSKRGALMRMSTVQLS